MLRKSSFGLLAAGVVVWTYLALSACATGRAITDMPRPKSVPQALLLATNELKAFVTTSNEAYAGKLIDEKTHLKVLSLAEQAKGWLSLSQQAVGVGDLETAQGQLNLAVVLLTQMRASLGGT